MSTAKQDPDEDTRRLAWERQQADEKAEKAKLIALGRQRAIAAREQSFGYSDFIRDFDVDRPSYWFGFVIRHDGVYVSVPDDNGAMSVKERAERSWHHECDVTKPALVFPYDIDELHAFVTAYHLEGVIPNDEVYWMIVGLSESGSPPVTTSKGVPKTVIMEKFKLPSCWKDKFEHLNKNACLAQPVLVRRGRPGKGGDALFNPVEFGAMLIRNDETNSSDYQFDVTMVSRIIQKHFKNWYDDWAELRDREFTVGPE